ncbi:MAG: polyketide cyclase/dehydrase [Flavobacteriaceae bacterium]|nr:MAG: polyketide cyclase/dehydrase [Flavobacteriaceae bacterium]
MKQILNLILLTVFSIIGSAQNQSQMTINENAPVIKKNEILIKAKPEIIWQTLTEINKWKNWNSSITESEINTILEIGSSFKWKINGSNINSKIQILETNKAFGWTGKAFGAKAIHIWYLEETKNGTIVRVEESMEGWFIKLFKKKMNQTLENDMNYWLKQLKNESEE